MDPNGDALYPDPVRTDHPDCIWIGDIDNNPGNGLEIVYGLAERPSVRAVNINSGRVIWTNNDNTEGQQVMLADFCPDLPGLETYGLNRLNRSTKDSLFIISATGQTLWKEVPDESGFTTAIKILLNWDGTNIPMCLAFKRGDGVMPEIRDGRGNIIHRLAMDGNICIGDFGGDSKEEILVYSTSTANIYAYSPFDYNQPAPNPGHPLPQTKANAKYSRYGSGEALPEATSTPPITIGDVNSDGNIDIIDALLIAQYYVDLNPPNFNTAAADVDRSGDIEIIDALLIAQYYVGLIESF